MDNITLTATQMRAVELLKEASGELFYQPGLYGFALSGADLDSRITRELAEELIRAGVVKPISSKACSRDDIIDQIVLLSGE